MHNGNVKWSGPIAHLVDHVGIRLREFQQTIDEIQTREIGGRVERRVSGARGQIHVWHALRREL